MTFHFACYFAQFLFSPVFCFSGMRFWLPQLKHVTTMWGSLRGFTRTRLFCPGTRSEWHFLQIRRVYTVGNPSLADIAILRAISTYLVASSGLFLQVASANSKRIRTRCLAICFVSPLN